jgi:hypothetical protein
MMLSRVRDVAHDGLRARPAGSEFSVSFFFYLSLSRSLSLSLSLSAFLPKIFNRFARETFDEARSPSSDALTLCLSVCLSFSTYCALSFSSSLSLSLSLSLSRSVLFQQNFNTVQMMTTWGGDRVALHARNSQRESPSRTFAYVRFAI